MQDEPQISVSPSHSTVTFFWPFFLAQALIRWITDVPSSTRKPRRNVFPSMVKTPPFVYTKTFNPLKNTMLWMIFSLLAAMLWAIVNVTDKYTMTKLVDNPLLPVLILGLVGLLSCLVIEGVYGLPLLSSLFFLMALGAGTFYILTMYFYYRAMKLDDVSKIIPLYYLSPIFILIMARAFLGEDLNTCQYSGMFLLVLGAILISAPYPFKIRLNKAAGFILLAAFCYAINQIFTKYLLKSLSFWVVFAYVRLSIGLCLVPVFFWAIFYRRHQFKNVDVWGYGVMMVNQVLNLSGVLAITIALTHGLVTLVNALASVQPMLVFLIATLLSYFFPHIIHEQGNRAIYVMKGGAITLMFCGTVLLS
jgi:transporter family protein